VAINSFHDEGYVDKKKTLIDSIIGKKITLAIYTLAK
jgi:hypothetical protein